LFYNGHTTESYIKQKINFQRMKDGAIAANSGHFDVEIDIPALKKLSKKISEALETFVSDGLERAMTGFN